MRAPEDTNIDESSDAPVATEPVVRTVKRDDPENPGGPQIDVEVEDLDFEAVKSRLLEMGSGDSFTCAFGPLADHPMSEMPEGETNPRNNASWVPTGVRHEHDSVNDVMTFLKD